MAKKRRQESEWGAERQGASLREERRAQLETAATRRRIEKRFLLRKNDWDEEKAHFRENRKRPK